MTEQDDAPDDLPEVVARAIELVDPATLIAHPDNPNEGDVPGIIAAIRRLGYVDPIVVQLSSRYVLSGNHRLEAVLQLGMPEVPVVFVPFDDDEALAYLLAGNELPRRGRWRNDALLSALRKVNTTPAGLTGTGFQPLDFSVLQRRVEPPPAAPSPPKAEPVHECPECGHRWAGSTAPRPPDG